MSSDQRNNPTRLQHYVPREYLKQWCGSDECLAVYVEGKIIPKTGTRGLAVERDLYAFVDLSAEELNHLHRLTNQILCPDNPLINAIVAPIFLNVLYFRSQKNDWTDAYAKVFNEFIKWPIRDKYRNTYNRMMQVVLGGRPFSDAELSWIHKETRSGCEAIETGIENAAWPVLREILDGGIGCVKGDDQKLRRLLLYIVNQCFRGPDYIEMVKHSMSKEAIQDGATPNLAHYVRYINPFYITNNLVAGKNDRKFLVVTNKTDLEFVTTDTPYAIYGEAENKTIPLVIYFPLAPKKGILYGYRNAINAYIKRFGYELHDRGLVDWLNREVIASAQRFVFATAECVLRDNDYHVRSGLRPRYVRGI